MGVVSISGDRTGIDIKLESSLSLTSRVRSGEVTQSLALFEFAAQAVIVKIDVYG